MSTQNKKKVQIKKKNSHPYFKLLPPLFICLLVVIYAIVHLTQSDGLLFNIPLNSLTGNANYTGYISHKNFKSILSKYDKDILIDAMFSASTNDQLIKLLDYLHQLSPNQKQFIKPLPIINTTTNIHDTNTIINKTKSPTKPPTASMIPVQSDTTWHNISYHNKYLPEYHLIPLTQELFTAQNLKPGGNKPKQLPGQNHKPNADEYNELISLLIQRSSQYKDTIWYKNLRKYKIELRTITLTGGILVSHPIRPIFMMYPKLRMMEYYICNTIPGFGNGFSTYWGVRSFAYWMNYNFKINCKSYYPITDKNKYFSAFLPFSIASNANMDKATDVINENNTIVTFMPGVDTMPAQHGTVHPTSLIFMYYNAYFQKIMNYEMVKASIDYYQHIKQNNRRIMIDKMSETNDIVIHFRCGDVLQLMHHVNDWDYGFLTIGFYKYVMNIGLKRKFGINWYDKMTNETTVWILSQLSDTSARKGELPAMKDCEYLLHYVIDNGLKQIFKPANIKITYDTDVNDDFYRMLVAPLLFCSPSTFCLNAGIANMNGIVVMPNRGAWVDFMKCIDPKNQSYYDDEQDFIVDNNSNVVAKNQLVIDTEKAGWHCNKIDNYDFNKQSYKQDIYAKRLAEYLVAH